jgi:Type six secretion immunity 3 domain
MPGRIWRGLAPIVGMGVVVAASTCFAVQAQSPPGSELERIEFALEDVHYQVLLPRRSRLAEKNRSNCVKIWRAHATRSMTFLELCSASGAIPVTYARRATFTNGVRVRYNIDHDIGGGSGGTEGEIKGQLEFGGKVFGLTCRDQAEWRNAPDWCLDYLRYLEVKERK